jgi:hypothetical protein
MRINFILAGLLLAMLASSGCSTVASKTNTLSDERIVSEAAGALGLSPTNLTLISRRTEGTNTYAELSAGKGQDYHCIINGGNILSFGMVNPPMCAKKGEPINTPSGP